MRPLRKGPDAVLLVLATVGLAALAATARANAIEAKVNDDIITTSGVIEQARGRLEQLAKQNLPDREARARELLRIALRELIESKLMEADGQRAVDANGLLKAHLERAVRHEIERQRRLFKGEGNLRDHIETKLKLTYTEYKKRLWQDHLRRLILERDVYRGITVRPQEIREYYTRHAEAYRTAATVDYRAIYLRVEGKADRARQVKLAEELVRRARRGEPFKALARDYSTGPHAAQGGLRQGVRLDHLAPPLRQALETLRPGQVSAPVAADEAVRVVKLEALSAEKVQPFEAVQEKIREALTRQKREKKFQVLMRRLWRGNYVWIRGIGRVQERPPN